MLCTAVPAIIKLVKDVKELRKLLRKKIVIVGVVSNEEVPPALRQCRDFAEVRDAVLSEEKIAVVHFRQLSFALKKADWVSSHGKDPKICNPDDVFWTELLSECSK